ncbi:hypothetical protein [Nitrosomonas sp.]|uniref:hypothetical protein n=1 Tax=Nitrosomonas sp. TaxID=42353 RepID=UPI0025CE31F4|nr:hypothetical protein [Nitrosomonas sp.]
MSENERHNRHTPPVSVEQLQAYLQSKQWFEDGKIRNVATIWHRHQDEDAEVVLPASNAKDFQQRVRDALIALASFEKRDVFEAIGDVKRLFLNAITVRVIHADTEDGTIPINDGVLLISKAKDMLSAAAQAIYAKRRHFSGPAPKDARECLDTLLLGQTEIGSYVVNVIVPNQANFVVDQVVADQETADAVPLSQAITWSLVTGLDALAKASTTYEKTGNLKAFDDAVLSGVSANLCDALLGFSGEKHNRTFEITVTAAAGPMFENVPRKFEFDGNHVEVLEQVSSYYKDDYVLPDRVLTGHITKLVRPKDETAGTITLDSMIGDVERKVRVELKGDDYHLAVIAHDQGKLVRVQGDVHIKPKAAELLNPKSFGVIEMEDLF